MFLVCVLCSPRVDCRNPRPQEAEGDEQAESTGEGPAYGSVDGVCLDLSGAMLARDFGLQMTQLRGA